MSSCCAGESGKFTDFCESDNFTDSGESGNSGKSMLVILANLVKLRKVLMFSEELLQISL